MQEIVKNVHGKPFFRGLFLTQIPRVFSNHPCAFTFLLVTSNFKWKRQIATFCGKTCGRREMPEASSSLLKAPVPRLKKIGTLNPSAVNMLEGGLLWVKCTTFLAPLLVHLWSLLKLKRWKPKRFLCCIFYHEDCTPAFLPSSGVKIRLFFFCILSHLKPNAEGNILHKQEI